MRFLLPGPRVRQVKKQALHGRNLPKPKGNSTGKDMTDLRDKILNRIHSLLAVTDQGSSRSNIRKHGIRADQK